MSSNFEQYFKPAHVASLAKVGNKIKILRGRLDGAVGNLKVGEVYTITGVFEEHANGFSFSVKERPHLYLKIDTYRGYAAVLAKSKSRQNFITSNPKNEPESE